MGYAFENLNSELDYIFSMDQGIKDLENKYNELKNTELKRQLRGERNKITA